MASITIIIITGRGRVLLKIAGAEIKMERHLLGDNNNNYNNSNKRIIIATTISTTIITIIIILIFNTNKY